MSSYCLEGDEQAKKCTEAREKIRNDNDGKLPAKYKHTTLESCRFCPVFMEDS